MLGTITMRMLFRRIVLFFVPWLFLLNCHPVAARPSNAEQVSSTSWAIEIHLQSKQLRVLKGGHTIRVFPIAVGKYDTPTPVGEWKVISKYKNWGSGFGSRWIGLNVPWGTYGIHGTNRPSSIGIDASHGCIRMFNHDVERLYDMIPIGTNVDIIGHPLGRLRVNPRRITEGDIGADVMLVQNRLKSGGYYEGPSNGKFNWGTFYAMRQFEMEQHLPVDGVVSLSDYIKLGLIE